jgi:hypothetical protein
MTFLFVESAAICRQFSLAQAQMLNEFNKTSLKLEQSPEPTNQNLYLELKESHSPLHRKAKFWIRMPGYPDTRYLNLCNSRPIQQSKITFNILHH